MATNTRQQRRWRPGRQLWWKEMPLSGAPPHGSRRWIRATMTGNSRIECFSRARLQTQNPAPIRPCNFWRRTVRLQLRSIGYTRAKQRRSSTGPEQLVTNPIDQGGAYFKRVCPTRQSRNFQSTLTPLLVEAAAAPVTTVRISLPLFTTTKRRLTVGPL